MIYRLSVISTKAIEPCFRPRNQNFQPANLLLVSRQIYREALEILYANNTVIMREYRRQCNSIFPRLGRKYFSIPNCRQVTQEQRLLGSNSRTQFYPFLFARAATLCIEIDWIFTSSNPQITSAYGLQHPTKLKALNESILHELSGWEHDNRKSVFLEFPECVPPPSDFIIMYELWLTGTIALRYLRTYLISRSL